MLIGLISDTHDHVPHIKKAAAAFKKRKADLILHAGDYCSPFTIRHFKGLKLKGIFGNNDGDKYLLISKFNEIGAGIEGEFMNIKAGDLNIAVYHGTYVEITNALCKSGEYDVVVTGHTHKAGLINYGNTIAINPGSAHGFDDKATIAFLDTATKEVEFEQLN